MPENLPTFGQQWQSRPTAGPHRPILGLNSAALWPNLAKSVEQMANIGQCWSNLGRYRPTLADLGQRSVSFGRFWLSLGRTSVPKATCRHLWNNFGALAGTTGGKCREWGAFPQRSGKLIILAILGLLRDAVIPTTSVGCPREAHARSAVARPPTARIVARREPTRYRRARRDRATARSGHA